MGVVVDAELIGHRQKQGVGFRDRFVLFELCDKNVRLRGVATAENGALTAAKEANLILVLAILPEIGPVAVVGKRKDTATDRHSRHARMPRIFPCSLEQ